MTKFRDFNYTKAISADETAYSDVFSLDFAVIEQLDFKVAITTYAAGTLVVTPQISPDKSNWTDLTDDATSTLSSATAEDGRIATPNPYVRFKMVSASSADMSVYIYAAPGSGDGGPTSSASAPTYTLNANATDYFVSEDSSFVTGDSPATLDVNTDLGANAENGGYISNDGLGDILVEISEDGSTFGPSFTLYGSTNAPSGVGEIYDLAGHSVDQIRLTWQADTSYRVLAKK